MEKLHHYKTFKEYVDHQSKKTADPKVRHRLQRTYNRRLNVFLERFKYAQKYGFLKKGNNCLCLGARLGEEVEALNTLGCRARGIDLVPNPPLVIEGDFMHLKYPDDTFDVVYSNSIDHAFDITGFFKEAYRVLKHKGFLILDVFPGEENVSEYEVYNLSVPRIIYKFTLDFDLELISVQAKLKRMYKKHSHRETQVIFRKGTGEKR